MTRHEILCKISHYEWMISSLTLDSRHESWIKGQLRILTASLAEFHANKGEDK